MNLKLYLFILIEIYLGVAIASSQEVVGHYYCDTDTGDEILKALKELKEKFAQIESHKNDVQMQNLNQMNSIFVALGAMHEAIKDLRASKPNSNEVTDCSTAFADDLSEIKEKLNKIEEVKVKIDDTHADNKNLVQSLSKSVTESIDNLHTVLDVPKIDLRAGGDNDEIHLREVLEGFNDTLIQGFKNMRDLVQNDKICTKLTEFTENMQKNLSKVNQTCKGESVFDVTYVDCKAALNASKTNGVYTLKPALPNVASFRAYCMKDEEGSAPWMIIQLRRDGSVDFKQTWDNYKRGFGDANGDHWLGLENIHALTNSRRHKLWVLQKNALHYEYSIVYDNFSIGSENEKYKAKSFGSFSTSSPGDILKNCLNAEFHTLDRDVTNQVHKDGDTGFWYNTDCFNLNAQAMSSGRRRIKAILNHMPVVYVHMAIKPME